MDRYKVEEIVSGKLIATLTLAENNRVLVINPESDRLYRWIDRFVSNCRWLQNEPGAVSLETDTGHRVSRIN